MGARIYFGVRCTVSAPGGTQRDLEGTLLINVLDENDNPPVAQFEESVIDVRLKEGVPLKVRDVWNRFLFINLGNQKYTITCFNLLRYILFFFFVYLKVTPSCGLHRILNSNEAHTSFFC